MGGERKGVVEEMLEVIERCVDGGKNLVMRAQVEGDKIMAFGVPSVIPFLLSILLIIALFLTYLSNR